MRYKVPQFIEAETSLIGPLSLRQFLFLAAPIALVYGLRYFISLGYVIVLGIIIIPLGVLCAFYKINGRPFYIALLSFANFAIKPQVYVWKKIPKLGKSNQQFILGPSEETKKDKRGLDEVAWRVNMGE